MNREDFESDNQYIEYLEDKLRRINGVVDEIEYVCDQYIENTTETDSVQMTVYCALCVKVMLDTIRHIDEVDECVEDDVSNDIPNDCYPTFLDKIGDSDGKYNNS